MIRELGRNVPEDTENNSEKELSHDIRKLKSVHNFGKMKIALCNTDADREYY
jgi:hypothetical protein